MLNYEGDITQENRQGHHLVDHDMDDVNIASITATAYDHHIDNSTDNDYCAHVYTTPSNPDSDFASALNKSVEISKMTGSISSVTKNDTPCELFYDPIMGQLEELEGNICDILGLEAIAHVKANTSAVHATRRKGVNTIQLINIWVVYEELASKFIDMSTKLCKHHADKRLY